jgi:hypothetical protein
MNDLFGRPTWRDCADALCHLAAGFVLLFAVVLLCVGGA